MASYKEDKQVSIIIPAYNVEEYIEKCLDSIIAQTYKNLQIIIINDGSSDGTKDILEKYKKKDERIKVINKVNEGVSKARNDGLKSATGDLLCFVDSDDYIKEDMIEKLYDNYKKSNVKLSICGFYEEMQDTKELIERTKGNVVELTQEEALKKLFEENEYRGYLWNKMFDRKIVMEHNIKFDSDLILWEDVYFVFQYILKVDKAVYDPSCRYYYVNRDTSASHKKISAKDAYNVIIAQERIISLLPEKNGEVYNQLCARIVDSAISVLRFAAVDIRKNKEYTKKAKSLIKDYKKNANEFLSKKNKVLAKVCSVCPLCFMLPYKISH